MDVVILALATTLLSLFFAYTNGVQDASSTAATMVACGAASPRAAVLYAATLGFAGALLGGSAVAFTIQALIDVPAGPLLSEVLLAAVTGAAFWNVVTWKKGLPSSSTHSLVGGLVGATAAGAGLSSVAWGLDELLAGQLAGVIKVVFFILVAVAAGFAGGYLIRKASAVLLRPASRSVTRHLLRAQWFTTGALSLRPRGQ